MSKQQKTSLGGQGFGEEYWHKNYSDPESMDGIANAKHHGRYLKAIFDLEYIDISSIVDLGAGLGYLAREVVKAFRPFRFEMIEPSGFAYDKLKAEWSKIVPFETTEKTLKNININEWCSQSDEIFDLGMCNSVLQYLSEKELESAIPLIAQKCRYLYLAVPTTLELSRQRSEIDFHDTFAISRPKKFYYELLKPHFTFVSARLLESKHFFDARDTFFSDLLYRF